MWPRRAQPKATIVFPAYGIVCSTEDEQGTNPDEGGTESEGAPLKTPTLPPGVRRIRDALRKADTSGWRAVTEEDLTSGKLERFVDESSNYHIKEKSSRQARIAWNYPTVELYARTALESPNILRFWVLEEEGTIKGMMQTGANPRIPIHSAEFDNIVKPSLSLPMLQTFENRSASAMKFAIQFSEQIGAGGRINTSPATDALFRLYQWAGFIDIQPPNRVLYLSDEAVRNVK